MKKYILRYNVEHKHGESDKKWRLYSEDGVELYLLDSVKIMVPCWTEDTPVQDAIKYSIVMYGYVKFDATGLNAVICDY